MVLHVANSASSVGAVVLHGMRSQTIEAERVTQHKFSPLWNRLDLECHVASYVMTLFTVGTGAYNECEVDLTFFLSLLERGWPVAT